MKYELLRSPQALRQLRHLRKTNPQIISSIIARINALSDNPRPPGATKLVNRTEWRVRVGDYRILYQIDDKNARVIIVSVSHRRDVYK
ncbi:MAG: type II toxin-antitoxin system RelE family toxin [Pyrinomonadaceae bacterium]